MFDDVLEKYSSKSKDVESSPASASDALDDWGAFGWLRGTRDRAIMLEIRHKNGRISSFSYAWLQSADFDPSEGITLNFSGKTVKLTGRNLNSPVRPNVSLLSGILRHRVPWIQEADGTAAMEASDQATVIEKIIIK